MAPCHDAEVLDLGYSLASLSPGLWELWSRRRGSPWVAGKEAGKAGVWAADLPQPGSFHRTLGRTGGCLRGVDLSVENVDPPTAKEAATPTTTRSRPSAGHWWAGAKSSGSSSAGAGRRGGAGCHDGAACASLKSVDARIG